jgi:broad-specificity NMP kinase
MGNNYIIAGFPGVGKTASADRKNVHDEESSAFKWTMDYYEFPAKRVKNEQWPKNYIDHIVLEDSIHSGDVILTSTHTEVLKGLLEHTNVIAVIPTEDQENEYLQRYLRRGSPAEFIRLMSEKWREFLQSVEYLAGIESDQGYTLTIIRLQPGQYLADILPR